MGKKRSEAIEFKETLSDGNETCHVDASSAETSSAKAPAGKGPIMIKAGISPEVVHVLNCFDIPGEIISLEPYGGGHLNDTLRAEWVHNGKKIFYIHQRINTSIFKDVDHLMFNILHVTEHIQRKLQSEGNSSETTLKIIPTKKGELYARDEQGGCWRTYDFVESSESFQYCDSVALAEEAARCFGRFNYLLSDLNPKDFHAIIPDFIDTPKRYGLFRKNISDNSKKRVTAVSWEIDFALSHEEECGVIMRGLHSGRYPWRVTHNDMKLNNLLFNAGTGQGKCVVDLDTCMPGSNLYDFGDLVRTTSMHAPEDETDLSKVEMNIDYFEALLRGFVAGIGDGLTREEAEVLYIVPRVLAFTMGLRFLTDYIGGDTYYRIHHPSHNLDRCRAQFKLVRSMEAQEPRMRAAACNY